MSQRDLDFGKPPRPLSASTQGPPASCGTSGSGSGRVMILAMAQGTSTSCRG